jgi:pseudouridine synthase
MADRIRIQKAIAHAGLMSRRAAEEAIRAGRISVDGQQAVLGDRVDLEAQVLTLDGVPIPVNPELETHLLYKPVGVVSTASDPQGRTTVVDLVSSPARLYPVGRLDTDSEGLLLLTNDGETANRVTHPRYGITKTYLARVEGAPRNTDIRKLVRGVELEDGPARALKARIVDSSKKSTMVEVVLGEGRNREVRRMLEAIGFPVTSLVRTAIGPITDQRLKPGQSRRLQPAEVRRLLESGYAND